MRTPGRALATEIIPGFDCVDMKRRGARRVYRRIKNMSVRQETAYWARRTAALRTERAGGAEV